MEAHFLSGFVSGESRFIAEPWYNPDGDCIVYQMADEAVVADRIDAILTIYRSAETKKAIGYQIKGVAALARKFGFSAMLVQSTESTQEIQRVSLSVLLLAAYEDGPKTVSRRRGYADALDTSRDAPWMPVNELNIALN